MVKILVIGSKYFNIYMKVCVNSKIYVFILSKYSL